MSNNLQYLASEFNKGVAKADAQYIELGKILLEAYDLVRAESTRRKAWIEWCHKNLKKKDGKPFAHKTIENYMYLAKNPSRVEMQKMMQRDNIRKARRRSREVAEKNVVTRLFASTKPQDQLKVLIAAWENATAKVQAQFLDKIGAQVGQ